MGMQSHYVAEAEEGWREVGDRIALRIGETELTEHLFRAVTIALLAALAFILARVALAAPLPERGFQALALGGASVLVVAAWKAVETRQIVGLLALGAVVIAALAAAPPALALLASGSGAIAASAVIVQDRRFFDGWATLNLALGALAWSS